MNHSAVLQFGLCCFRLSADGGSRKQLVAEPYNIYVAKRPFRNKFCNDRFVFQAESIDFLSNCKFDYNKCFRGEGYYCYSIVTAEAVCFIC